MTSSAIVIGPGDCVSKAPLTAFVQRRACAKQEPVVVGLFR